LNLQKSIQVVEIHTVLVYSLCKIPLEAY